MQWLTLLLKILCKACGRNSLLDFCRQLGRWKTLKFLLNILDNVTTQLHQSLTFMTRVITTSVNPSCGNRSEQTSPIVVDERVRCKLLTRLVKETPNRTSTKWKCTQSTLQWWTWADCSLISFHEKVHKLRKGWIWLMAVRWSLQMFSHPIACIHSDVRVSSSQSSFCALSQVACISWSSLWSCWQS